MFLAVSEICWSSSSLLSTSHSYPMFSMWPYRWQCKGLRYSECDSHTATIDPSGRELSSWYWNLEVLDHAGSMFAIVFTEGWQFILQNSGLNVTCWILWGDVHPKQQVTSDATLCVYRNWIWNLLSVVPFGLSWAHKWKFLVMLTTLQVNVLLFWTKCSSANGACNKPVACDCLPMSAF
jgi:hypothetical protein